MDRASVLAESDTRGAWLCLKKSVYVATRERLYVFDFHQHYARKFKGFADLKCSQMKV